MKSVFRGILWASVLCFGLAFVSSCQEDGPAGGDVETTVGSISGVVTDTDGQPISAVVVAVKDFDQTAQTAEDGTYSLPNVSFKGVAFVTFTKEGYSTIGMTVPADHFVDGQIVLNPVMEFGNAVIKGTVLDGGNSNAPLKDVTVSIGIQTTVTDEAGAYTFEGLTLQDYEVKFTKAGYPEYTKKVTKGTLIASDGTVEIGSVILGGAELLPGLAIQNLIDADEWTFNDYRGGYSRGGGVVDWSTSFMSAQIKFAGINWEMQNEGCTLRGENNGSAAENLNDFASFCYGKKLITEDNKIFTIYARTHQGSLSTPAKWGVAVIDMSAASPKVDVVGGVREHPSTDYTEFEFDLSDYVGKEVVIAPGIYYTTWWVQLCLAHFSFAKEKNIGDNYLPGTPVSGLTANGRDSDWHMTQEMVRSTMTHPGTSFIGYIPNGISINNKSNPAYQPLHGTDNIMSEWAFMYVNKDTEPLASEGFVIKTRSGVSADYNVPESYFYNKFAINAANNEMVITVRNFDASVPTIFKVTAITEDGKVSHLAPVSNTAQQAAAVSGGNGCWSFINNQGSTGTPDEYAQFVYDLSSYTGENVMITLGVFKGDVSDGEQKLCIYGIDLN